MSFFRQLFPPVVPPSAPAYDGTKAARLYFQMSVANSREQFKHAQVTFHRIDTNQSALTQQVQKKNASGQLLYWDIKRDAFGTITSQTETTSSNGGTNSPVLVPKYPMGIIFYKNDQLLYDSAKGTYYIELEENLLPLDFYYKVQIRLGAQDINGLGNIDYTWLNNPVNVSQFSEWSNVCIIKPITVPIFDLVGFQSKDANGKYVEPVYETDNLINIVNTPGFLFVGQYSPQDGAREEIISSYQMILFEDNHTAVEESWKVLSDSGVKRISEYQAVSLQHSFEYVLEKGKTYYVKYIVTSKNGYVASKIYKVYVMYADITLYNAFHITPNQDTAKISLHVEGKQLLFNTMEQTEIATIKDGSNIPADILNTHMAIAGEIEESENLDFYGVGGKWVVQLRAMGIKPHTTRAAALDKPVFTITEKNSVGPFYTKIKLCAMKYKISFNEEPVERWVNEFVLVKELWPKNGTKPFIQQYRRPFGLQADGRVIDTRLFINPMQEYYFYIKEDNGYMHFHVETTRVSTNTELQAFVNKY